MTVTADPYYAHREQGWEFIEHHGIAVVADPLRKLMDGYDEVVGWRQANDRWFGGRMVKPDIRLTPPPGTTTYGDTRPIGSAGGKLEIRIRPTLLEGTHPKVHGNAAGCFRFVADVLLHEMIHQWAIEVTGETDDGYKRGHGPHFAAKCNQIGADLGLPEVVAKNRPGKPKQPLCAIWPHNVRPPEYYLGACHVFDPEKPAAKPAEELVFCPWCDGTAKVVPEIPAGHHLAVVPDVADPPEAPEAEAEAVAQSDEPTRSPRRFATLDSRSARSASDVTSVSASEGVDSGCLYGVKDGQVAEFEVAKRTPKRISFYTGRSFGDERLTGWVDRDIFERCGRCSVSGCAPGTVDGGLYRTREMAAAAVPDHAAGPAAPTVPAVEDKPEVKRRIRTDAEVFEMVVMRRHAPDGGRGMSWRQIADEVGGITPAGVRYLVTAWCERNQPGTMGL